MCNSSAERRRNETCCCHRCRETKRLRLSPARLITYVLLVFFVVWIFYYTIIIVGLTSFLISFRRRQRRRRRRRRACAMRDVRVYRKSERSPALKCLMMHIKRDHWNSPYQARPLRISDCRLPRTNEHERTLSSLLFLIFHIHVDGIRLLYAARRLRGLRLCACARMWRCQVLLFFIPFNSSMLCEML